MCLTHYNIILHVPYYNGTELMALHLYFFHAIQLRQIQRTPYGTNDKECINNVILCVIICIIPIDF